MTTPTEPTDETLRKMDDAHYIAWRKEVGGHHLVEHMRPAFEVARTAIAREREAEIAAAVYAAHNRIAYALESQCEWEPCDCGCPNGRKPKTASGVTWLRAASLVRVRSRSAE